MRGAVVTWRTLTAVVALLTLSAMSQTVAGQILSVSSFRECVSFSDSSGSGDSLDCGDSSFATVVEMRLQTGQDGEDNTERFEAQITVVPNQASDETQTGSGTDCPAPDDTTCQTVTPGTVSASAGAATHAYRLTEVQSGKGLPYEHYFNIFTHIIDSEDASLRGSDGLDLLLAMDPPAQCVYVSRMITNGATPISVASEDGTMQAVFDSADSNFDHIGCGQGAHAPQNLRATTAVGAVSYTYGCAHICTDSTSTCNTYVEVSANFQDLGPKCRLFRVADKPEIAADVTITLNALGSPPIQETIKLSTIASNLSGATSISTPGGTMAATIVGTFSADGLEGASLPGYLITCTSDGSILDLGGASLSDNPFEDLPSSETDTCSFNDGSPDMPYPGPAVATEPCAIAHLTGGDPFAMYAFLNDSMGVTQGTACGMSNVAVDIFSRPPAAMNTGSSSAPSVEIKTLVPRTQGGTGAYSDLVFCVPGHGLEFMDRPAPSPCDIMDAMRTFEADEAAASMVSGYIPGGKLSPYAPFVYTPLTPNAWPAIDTGGGSYFYVVKPNKPASLDIELTLAGGAIGIREGVPNASLDPTVTFCAVGAGRIGSANYKVCNDGASPAPANYNLLIQCGLESAYNPLTLQFTAPSGTLVTPASRLLANVPPGECRTPGSDGLFGIQVTALDTTDADAILCAYTVQSADTTSPSNVVLARATIQCLRQDIYSNGTAVTPGSGVYAPIDYLDNNVTMELNQALADAMERLYYLYQDEEADDDRRKIIVSAITIAVFVCAIGVCCAISCGLYSLYVSNKVKKASQAPSG